MQIYGFQKTTLLDYPGHLAACIFTGGCNFCCPFCQNGQLVLYPQQCTPIAPEEIFAALKKRKGILTGVCITGGEPTLQPDLFPFLEKIKELGYFVKLDTNGYRPEIVQALYEQKLIDYIAMDIKNSPARYAKTAGLPSLDITRIQSCVDYIMHCGIAYEFRTTTARQLHTAEDFLEIGAWLAGCQQYFLQSYADSGHVISRQFSAYTKEELLEFIELLKPMIPHAALRGVG